MIDKLFHQKRLCITLAVLLLCVVCAKNANALERGIPTVTTTAVSIVDNSVISGGNVIDDGGSPVIARGVCYGTLPYPDLSSTYTHTDNGTGTGVFTSVIDASVTGAIYVRAYATNSSGTAYGDQVTVNVDYLRLPRFDFDGLTYVVAPDPLSSNEFIGINSACSYCENLTDFGYSDWRMPYHSELEMMWQLRASIGGFLQGNTYNPIFYHYSDSGGGCVLYWLSGTPICNSYLWSNGYKIETVGGVTYTYRCHVRPIRVEITLPTVTTNSITNIQQNYATCGGNVTNSGGAAVTERGICWSTNHLPTLYNSHISSGTGTGNYSITISGLLPGTQYYVRAYATNSEGTAYGEEVSFTTTSAPTVQTNNVTNITNNSATCGGNVTDEGSGTVTARGVCWSTSPNPTLDWNNHTEDGMGTGSFTSNITGLTSGTQYYVRAYATNSEGTAYGEEVSFTTTSAPTVQTNDVTNITYNSATCGGNVSNTGGAPVTERGICWSTNHNPTINNSHTNNGVGTGSYSITMSGLLSGTLYYVRAYATNSVGTTYGNEVSFTTAYFYKPTVTTNSVTNITYNSATCGGNVTNEGSGTVTARGICWNTSHNPTINNSHTSNGTGVGSYSSVISNLASGTCYYVRAYATNSAGTNYGNEVYFNTSFSHSVTTNNVINITQTSASCGGYVTAYNGATVTDRGVCWSTTNQNPTLSDSYITNGTGTGNFTSNLTGLTQNTTYYVRAYATSSEGTVYGETKQFTTTKLSYRISEGGVVATSAGGYFYDSGGPNNEYGNNEHYIMTFTSNQGAGTRIQMNFTEFSLWQFTSEVDDYLVIYNGMNTSAPVIGTYYGNNSPGLVTATNSSGALTFVFISNDDYRTIGWEAAISIVGQSNSYTINTSMNIADAGMVSGGGTYQQGQSCTLTAVPTAGYEFVKWTKNGTQVSTNAAYSFTVNQSATYMAHFQAQNSNSYTISTTSNPSSGGTVNGGGSYQQGQSCTVTATANSGYTFTNWTENGNVVSTNASYSFTVNGNRNLVANFVPVSGDNCAIVFELMDSYGDGWNNAKLQVAFSDGTPTQQLTFTSGYSATYVLQVGDGVNVTLSWIQGSWDSECSYTVKYEVGPQIHQCTPSTVNSTYSFQMDCSCADNPITFADAQTKLLCVNNWDTNGDGELSYAEAVAVTDLGSVFTNKPNVTSFEELVYFSGLTSISNNAFNYCSGMISVVLPNSVTSIGNNAFFGCTNLTSIIIPGSVTSLGAEVFRDCPGLTQMSVRKNNSVYDSRENCNAIIKKATNELVYGCKNTVIPNSVTSIGGAFDGCSSLTSIVIPSSVTSIGNYGFYNCYNLSSMTVLADNPPTLGTGVFTNVDKTIPVYVPCGVLSTYQNTEGWNDFSNYQSTDCQFVITTTLNPVGSGILEGAGTYDENSICTLTAASSMGYTFINWMENGEVVSTEATYSFTVTGNRNLFANFSVLGDGPIGAVNGLFSVSDSQSVYFSQGNLQYKASTNTWQFASNQYDYIGDNNSNISQTYNGWIDLFGWGTSGHNHGAVRYQPWSTSTTSSEYYAYGNSSYNLYDQTGKADWGYNAISNGGSQTNQWRTLTHEEWEYVFDTRTTSSGIRYAKAQVNNVNGVILLPDNWNSSTYSLCNTNQDGTDYTSNIVGNTQWSTLEDAGAIFLPAAGGRSGASVYNVGARGYYWSASYYDYDDDTSHAWTVFFNSGYLGAYYYTDRYSGLSVRLVRSVGNNTYTINATANPMEGGIVSGGNVYIEGVVCTLTATPAAGYTFVNWTENGEIVSTDAIYSFTVTDNRTLIANFTQNQTTNHWMPVSQGTSGSMVLTGKIQINGIDQMSDQLELGVFCGNECRGSAIAHLFTYVQPNYYMVDPMVYGDAGDTFTFKLYDHNVNQELDLTSPEAISFNENGYGTAFEPYTLNFLSTVNHIQDLSSGWNWWSTYIEMNDIDGLEMLKNSLGNSCIRIQSRNQYLDNYTSFWYGTLTEIANEQSYRIRTNTECQAVLVGVEANPDNHPITINNGWNWIGFPSSQSLNLSTAMSGFSPVVNDQIKSRHQYASYLGNNYWYGTLNTLEPGQGYMYKSNDSESKTLVYQTGRDMETIANVTPEGNYYTPFDESYANNMTITAMIEMDGQELLSDGYELAAIVGNECRGSVKLIYVEPLNRYLAFLLVYGENEEDMSFVLTNGHETSWSSDCIKFVADGIVGSITEPVVLDFGTLGINDGELVCVNIFPNPSNGVFNIEGNGINKVEVINIYGQTILSTEITDNHTQVDLSGKANGIYLLRVIANNGIVTNQLIKE